MSANKTEKPLWTEDKEKLFQRVETLLTEVERMRKAMQSAERNFDAARYAVQESTRKAQRDAMKLDRVTKEIVNLRIKVANVIDEAFIIGNLIDKPLMPDEWPGFKSVDNTETQ